MIDIPQYSTFATITQIKKGWSKDTKYFIVDQTGERFLLRIADISAYAHKQEEFFMMKQVKELDLPTPVPIDFGICNGAKSCYSLFTWCSGKNAEDVLPLISEKEQYILGLKSGRILKKMHSIPTPDGFLSWNTRYVEKIDRNIRMYRACQLRLNGDEQMIAYIEKSRHLLKMRPQCYQHGDYHTGNIVISRKMELSVIDFNRFDYGDPWEEFNRIVWSAMVSPHFATGQIHGYFDGEPPTEFFRLFTLYIANNTLGSLPWAIPFGQAEIDTMMNLSQNIIQWFENMQSTVPTWYHRVTSSRLTENYENSYW